MTRRSLNFGESFEGLINSLSFSSHNNLNHCYHHHDNNMSNLSEDLNQTSEDQQETNNASHAVSNENIAKTNNKNVNICNPSYYYNPSEQALLSAIYNTIAISGFVGCLCLCGLLLIVLQAFVRSILWALLTSAFLFSFKRYLTEWSLKKLSNIETTGSTLAFESVIFPFKLIDSSVNYVWSLFLSKYRHLIAIVLAIILFHFASSFYESLFDYSILLIKFANRFSNLMTYYVDNSWQLTLTLSIGYLVAISFHWNNQDYKVRLVFKILSYSIWMSLFFLSTKLMGSYRPFFTMVFMFLICLGFYSSVYDAIMKSRSKNSNSNDNSIDELGVDENNHLNHDSLTSSMHSTNIENANNMTSQVGEESEDTLTKDESQSIDSTASSSTQSNSTFLRSTIYNLYQTSIYYFNNGNNNNSNSKQEKHTNKKRLERKRENSDKYFFMLFWLLICIKLRYDLYIIIPVIVLIWKLLKYSFTNILSFVLNNENTKYYFEKSKMWFEMRKDVLMPQPFYILFKLFLKGDLKVNQLLQKSIDNLITLLMIIFLSLFVLTTVIVLSMQVHSESIELITIGSNIINENVYGNSDLKEWLPEKQKLNELYQATMNNFYLYGREWLSKTLKSSTDSSSSGSLAINNKSDYLILEAQLLKQWDSLYSYLSSKNTYQNKSANLTQDNEEVNVDLPPSSVPDKNEPASKSVGTQTPEFDNEKSLWKKLIFSPSYTNRSLDWQNIVVIVKDNFGILMSILDSLYMIIKGNVNLLSTVLYTVISIIFSSGFALVNFFFSLIVYVTALFYLLSMSGTRYKPFEWLTELRLPKNNNNNTTENKTKNNNGDLLISAIEDSITSVFVVSLKMAIFFGVYTYLVNCLFSVSIVYLTSILAALFAFLPLLGTYW